MADGTAAYALAVDEGAGGGVGVEELDGAVSVVNQFGMVL